MIANIFHRKGISNSMKSLDFIVALTHDFAHSTKKRLKGCSKNHHSTKISPTKMYDNMAILPFYHLKYKEIMMRMKMIMMKMMMMMMMYA